MTLEVEYDPDLFKPNPGGQEQFMNDWHSEFVALCGGWYSGKTWAGARKLATLHVHNAFDDFGQPTYVHSHVVAQDYQLAYTVNIPELQSAFDEMGLTHRFCADRSKFWFELPDLGTAERQSLIYVRSADAPEKINGYTVGAGWGDEVARWAMCPEDPKRDPLLQFRARIRDARARIKQGFFTFTPEGQGTAVYRDFELKPKPGHTLYRVRTKENHTIRDYAEKQEAYLSAELAKQYLEGESINLGGGRVYANFDVAVHANRQLIPNPKLPVHLTMDFNIDPGMHGVIGQHDEKTGIITALYVIHDRDLPLLYMLDKFKLWLVAQNVQFPEIHVFGDPAGRQRSVADAIPLWTIVKRWFDDNLGTIPVRFKYLAQHQAVQEGVNAINMALRPMKGEPRYFIDERCTKLIEDYQSLRWDGNKISKADDNRSHASDAERYRLEVISPVRRMNPRQPRVGSI